MNNVNSPANLASSFHIPADPGRVISWWSRLEHLTWPNPTVRDFIQRRADLMAEARIDTVIHFGFHFRFDFLWYFGLLHGLLADIAEALHQRNIRFLDHYSCNLLARPRTTEELHSYHTLQRHHVAIHPDAMAADKAEYRGFLLNDLRETDVETGEPTYVSVYQCETMCHNNPDFLTMHGEYIRRQLAEIPLDGLMVDDMCWYGYFRTCGCRHCRQRFQIGYGRELPPMSEKGFWGDTSRHPSQWGNYGNPAFRDWVQMRYQSVGDHLAHVRQILGPEKILMTCCCSSGPLIHNSLGLSYESFIDPCDWVMLENCGLSVETVQWPLKEPEAMLHKAIGEGKPGKKAPSIALSYFLYDDGAYLGWAVSRLWGVANWASTLTQGIPIEPTDVKEDAELVRPFNRWETAHENMDAGEDVPEVLIAFVRDGRDAGWTDTRGRDHWQRARSWAQALLEANIAYRFVLTAELEHPDRLLAQGLPLILDGVSHLNDRQSQTIIEYLRQGRRVWVVAPLGICNEQGIRRTPSLLEILQKDGTPNHSLLVLSEEAGPEVVASLIAGHHLTPRIRTVSGLKDWAVRLRRYATGWVLHVLNRSLAGREHPTLQERNHISQQMVLQSFVSQSATDSLVLEIDTTGVEGISWRQPILVSPEFSEPREVRIERGGDGRLGLRIPVADLRLYGQVVEGPCR